MVRATWSRLPEDPIKSQNYINRILEGSSCAAVHDILKNYSRVRDLEFTSKDAQLKMGPAPVLSKLAVAIQLRGEELKDPCTACAEDDKPFVGCVRILDQQNGRCANCVFRGKRCSSGDVLQSPIGCYSIKRSSSTVQHVFHTEAEKENNNPVEPGRHDSSEKYEEADSAVKEHSDLQSLARREVSSEQYAILGNLVLPRPPPEVRDLAEVFEQDLKKLDMRDMTTLQDCPISDLQSSFAVFKDRESALGSSLGQLDVSPAHLVMPSGSLASPLAHRLNQPSFTTDKPRDNETADYSNGCIAQVIGNAYNPRETLLFDHIHRRDHTSEAIEEFPPELLELHERFTNDIAQSMQAKVEIIYGAKVQKRLLKTHSFDVLRLWGDFEGITLLLVHEDSYANKEPDFKYRRIMLMACHPQHMFYQARYSYRSKRQDLTMRAATLMVRQSVPWIENYFAEKKWRLSMPSALCRRELGLSGQVVKEVIQAVPTILIEDEPTGKEAIESIESSSPWDFFFGPYPRSNDILRELVPEALKVTKTLLSRTIATPDDLPAPLLEWFRGQKQILFNNLYIESFDDIILALERNLGKAIVEGNERASRLRLKETLEMTLQNQLDTLHTVNGQHQQVWHSRFDGQAIQVCCEKCRSPLKPDLASRWSVFRPGYYIATHHHRSQCHNCHAKDIKAVPISQDIKYTTLPLRKLYRPEVTIVSFDPEPYLREQSTKDPGCLAVVNSWCIRCGENTLQDNGSNVFIDREPRWTLGNPPKYLERRKVCLRCKGEHIATRFVPVEPTIPSLYRAALSDFHKRYAGLGLAARLLLLEILPSSSRTYRYEKKD